MSTDKGVPSSRQEVLNLVDKHGKVDLSVRNRGHDVDYDKAFALAVLSKAVYWGGVTGEGDDDIHDVGERLLVKYRSIQTFYRENAAAFILECDDVIVLAWRGSDDLKDWISHNFWAFPVLLEVSSPTWTYCGGTFARSFVGSPQMGKKSYLLDTALEELPLWFVLVVLLRRMEPSPLTAW